MLVSILLIESRTFGRLQSIRYTILIRVILMFCLLFIQSKRQFLWTISACVFLGTITTSILFPFSSELYETSIRNTAASAFSLMLRISGLLCPFVVLPLHEIHYKCPYMVFSLCGCVSLIMSFLLRRETRGHYLDDG